STAPFRSCCRLVGRQCRTSNHVVVRSHCPDGKKLGYFFRHVKFPCFFVGPISARAPRPVALENSPSAHKKRSSTGRASRAADPYSSPLLELLACCPGQGTLRLHRRTRLAHGRICSCR